MNEHCSDFIDYVNSNFSYIDGRVYRVRFRGVSCEPVEVKGSVNSSGYMTVYCGVKISSLHVVSWVLNNGNYKKGLQIDHINRDKSDNRIENLRICSDIENKKNVGKRSDNTSGYKGVYFNRCTEKWVAQCHIGKPVYIGSFDTPESANLARIKYESEL